MLVNKEAVWKHRIKKYWRLGTVRGRVGGYRNHLAQPRPSPSPTGFTDTTLELTNLHLD